MSTVTENVGKPMTISVVVKWIPRILSLLLIALFFLMSFDMFTQDQFKLFEQSVGFVISNIPTVLLMLGLFVSWYKPLYGAIFYLFFGIIGTVFFNAMENPLIWAIITAPTVIIAIMYYVDSRSNVDGL